MNKFTHLDIYMELLLKEQQDVLYPNHLRAFVQSLTGFPYINPSDMKDFKRDVPRKYEMAQWLHTKGYSQKKISEILKVSQAAVSQYVNKKAPKIPYHAYFIGDTVRQLTDQKQTGDVQVNRYDGPVPPEYIQEEIDNEKRQNISYFGHE